ncbi:hypothetical protein [Pseudonocardia hydrocarbonoxydans]|uniref:hypothetical protein n=1 Tax=Pseudonocardia hydrocarbonoxydans TaxID=76726 RepID=UPI0031E0ED31
MTRPEQDQQLEALALELEGQDHPDESYLDAVNRIRGAWSTAREMLAEQPTSPATDPTTSADRLA